jgi:hypothetical protein
MAQVLTLVSIVAAVLALAWYVRARLFRVDPLDVSIHLDRSAPGAHLIWEITNTGIAPLSLTKLIIHSRDIRKARHIGSTADLDETVPLAAPKQLDCGDRILVPTDVDWSLLAARKIAVEDATGREHTASAQQLRAVQEQLREVIDRPVHASSARDWLYGAANLAFGVVILGLGFFMLMWVIATG